MTSTHPGPARPPLCASAHHCRPRGPPLCRQVFEGRGGGKVPDFEAFHHSTAHTSPLLHDIDLDGVPDIVLATYDGAVLFFKDTVSWR